MARVIGPMLGGLALTQLGASCAFTLTSAFHLSRHRSLLIIRPQFVPTKTGESRAHQP